MPLRTNLCSLTLRTNFLSSIFFMMRFSFCSTRICKVGNCVAFQLWTPKYFTINLIVDFHYGKKCYKKSHNIAKKYIGVQSWKATHLSPLDIRVEQKENLIVNNHCAK